ncbi:SICAvar, type I [Plasmodium knowlesi strain H]|uniref:SICAvar, type I n=2 Tax=Plasmodium knowlesi TaxID=5850 RepID=B3LBT0_PLAKH|nr:SICAvar, type I [Plasmodium knowlesi strain H]OTN64192.1 SICAvar type I [Plasmodium knowlesi]CAA9990720.1 SICAvar, type I [Plasmodium knowlesi strain H]VVS80194.1 SICAvar, type I [Plasmodium knowlesi strain H]|eukprot:XP_002262011.1 SICA antigen [Plasmodium knowlesi strain H]
MAQKFAGVLTKWMQNEGGSAGQRGQINSNTASQKLQDELKKMFEELRTRIEEMNFPKEINNACASAGTKYGDHDKLICKTLLRTVYWMNGIAESGKPKVGGSDQGGEQGLRDYFRCIVGYSAMAKLLSNKRDVQKIVQAVQDAATGGIKDEGNENINKKCESVTLEDMEFGSQILGGSLEEWVRQGNRNRRMMSLYLSWTLGGGGTGTEGEEIDENKDQKKGILELFKDKKAAALYKKVDPGVQLPGGSPTSPEGKFGQVLKDADSCETEDSDNIQNCLKKKLELTIGKPCNSSEFCKRLECVLRKKRGLDGNSANTTTKDDKVQEEVKAEVTSAATNISTSGTSDTDVDQYCSTVQCTNGNADGCVSKETCKIIVKALKEVHKIGKGGQGSDGDKEINRIFKSTIHCMALNAFIQKLKQQADQGGYGCAVQRGIDKAFDEKNLKNKRKEWCGKSSNVDGSCEECGKDLQVCTGSSIGKDFLSETVKQELNKDTNTNIQPTLDNIHSQATLCDRLHCAIDHWKIAKGAGQTPGSNDEEFWTGNDSPVKTLWDELARKMKDNGGTRTTGNGTDCDSFETDAEKKACNYLNTGFKQLYEPDPTTSSSSGTANSEVLGNPSFRQTMGCFLLHSYAKYMQKNATCNIEEGIKQAFDSWQDLKNKAPTSCNGANGKGPCVPCQWNEDNFKNCSINTNGAAVAAPNYKVEDKLKTIFEDGNNDTNISAMLTKINKRDKLCDHMKCIASHLNSTNGQHKSDNFWKDDVKKLWEDLAKAMMQTNGKGTVTECNGFDNPSAERACNYLHAAFTKLKELSQPTASQNKNGEILSKDPSLKQAMGCFLLHSYATHIKGKSTCVIDAGISKAFNSWHDPSKKASSICNGSGTEPCVLCQWNDKDYDTCKIKTNGAGGTAPTEVKTKVDAVLTNDNSNISTMLTEINKMTTLCDGLQCIASHLNSPNAKTKIPSVDKFWDKTGEVADLWNTLSKEMTDKGKNGSVAECNTMDDGSATGGTANGRPATKPEKKACNYLHAGFEKLKQLSKPSTPQTQNGKILDENPLLRQTVGCFLLKEYAKQMQSKSKCVIEAGLKSAFNSWNSSNNGNCSGTEPCVPCQWNDANIDECKINTTGADGSTTQTEVTQKLTLVQPKIDGTATTTMEEVNKTEFLCDKLQCAASNWFKQHATTTNGTDKKTWCNFWDEGVKPKLEEMFTAIETNGGNPNSSCSDFGDGNVDSVERKACNHITAGLNYIDNIQGIHNGQPSAKENDKFFKQTMMCAALNFYADQIKEKSQDKCPIDEIKIREMFNEWNGSNNKCLTSGDNTKDCFVCQRQREDFNNCKLLVDSNLVNTSSTSPQNGTCNNNATEVKTQIDGLLNDSTIKMKETLSNINEMKTFCTQLQCAAKKWKSSKNRKNGKNGQIGTLSWSDIHSAAETELTALLHHMTQSKNQEEVAIYCNDDANWSKLGHKQSKTNKAACLHFAAGLQHIYTHGNGYQTGQFKGPSFEQTMGCLFLKEYSKQLQTMANDKKRGNSWVHPHCSIEDGINHAFGESNAIMNASSKCNNGPNSCFVCTLDDKNDYKDCSIGNDKVPDKVEPMFTDDQTKQKQMQETLENTVCPILLTDILTPFLPLAPVSIGLSAMAYYLWKYFGPLGKGGARFRRSPAEIPGPSVQEQVLDHVQQDSSHEYRLVKERKPRSAPTRTKRSGRVNRRTIIEIHFEVLDECQKGDTQLNQKDFLELLVQEFMGSELMEEEQVPKEEVLMEGVPMESIPLEQVPMERVPSLGSGLMV